MWVVFDHPADFPDFFVARRQIARLERIEVTNDVLLAPDLDRLREQLPRDLYRIERHTSDAPQIIETWL